MKAAIRLLAPLLLTACAGSLGEADPTPPVVEGETDAPLPDTQAPARSSGAPMGTLPVGTRRASVELVTDEPASCRMSASAGTSFSQMTRAFVNTGGTIHSTPLMGLSDGQRVTWHVRCEDEAGNSNADDFIVTFSIEQAGVDVTPPAVTLTAPGPGQVLPLGTTSVTLRASTDEASTCRHSLVDEAWADMPNTFAMTGMTSHSTLLTGLAAGQSYTSYVRCQDAAGNPTLTSVSRAFSVSSTPPTKVVLFDSDWSTALGTTMSAYRDTSKTPHWNDHAGPTSMHSVVAATGLGFPSTMQNVYRVNYDGENGAHVVIVDGWTGPAIGQTQCYRTYMRHEIPNSLGNIQQSAHHPIEPNWGNCPFSWEFTFSSNSDGTFDMTFLNGRAARWQDIWWSLQTPLNKFETYRIEWCFQRQSTNGYRPALRIYDANDVLVRDGSDFLDSDNQTLDGLPAPEFDADPACMDDLLIGNNGPSSWPTGANQRIYWGGVQVCRGDWCGAY